jgi:hypothetical protein
MHLTAIAALHAERSRAIQIIFDQTQWCGVEDAMA